MRPCVPKTLRILRLRSHKPAAPLTRSVLRFGYARWDSYLILIPKPNHGELEFAPFLEDQVVLIVPVDHP